MTSARGYSQSSPKEVLENRKLEENLAQDQWAWLKWPMMIFLGLLLLSLPLIVHLVRSHSGTNISTSTQ